MNITRFNHYQEIGEEIVIFHAVGYLSSDRKSFDLDSLKSEWEDFDESKVSEETKEQIKLQYLNID